MKTVLLKLTSLVLLLCVSVLPFSGCTENTGGAENSAAVSDKISADFIYETDNGDESTQTKVFQARVIGVGESSITVMPFPNTSEYKAAGNDGIVVSTLLDDGCKAEGFAVGDYVRISYDGRLAETYPVQILKVYMIEKAENDYTNAKPVIYLYPEQECEVSVKLTYDGELTCTYPAYSNGWTVTASPDGELTDKNGQTYNYLYWEGKSYAFRDTSHGFCVKGEDTAAFLEDALARLGLNRREANEFIVYWLPVMQENPYNIISFAGESYTKTAKLDIAPMPDTLIRVFMSFEASDTYVSIPEQELSAPERVGFCVVEWGGTDATHR